MKTRTIDPKKSTGLGAASVRRRARHFNGLPLKEATFQAAFDVKPEDIADAQPADPEQCALALCFRRTYSSSTVVILRRVAFVDLDDPDTGERTVFRFKVPERTLNQVIKPLDLGQTPKSGTYYLLPPARTDTLEFNRAYQRKFVDKQKAAGKKRVYKMGKERVFTNQVGTLRSGQGLIHHTFEDS